MKIRKIISSVICAALAASTAVLPVTAKDDKLLAFPGAEGGGKYTTGARGVDNVEIYHVTNLDDDGEGSLRDAVSEQGRIVVFDVGGIIELKSKLLFNTPNVTVLGQTAPGDGITITGYDAEVKADNIILRYLRIRPTDESGGEPDGLGGRWVDNIIIDHCSVSWGVDEMLTLYSGSIENGKVPSTNVTVQYCISSESLRMSSHIKGAHGYGGIIGGTTATYHHNLFAHHDSRNPRFDRNLQGTDMVNNVIYNWGNNSSYGAEPYSYNKVEEFSTPEYVSKINIRNNYYKYGPSTKPSIRSKIFEVTNDESVMYKGDILKSDAYINGNYVYDDEIVTSDNTIGDNSVYNIKDINILDKPVDMGEYEIDIQTAEEAFETTLETAGASIPRRDAIDARVVADVKNGTGRIINRVDEVGGFAGISAESKVFEIPEEWKKLNGMGNAVDADIAPSGYTWVEEYVNEWTQKQIAPSNPEITVHSPATAKTCLTEDKTDGRGFWTIIYNDEPVSYYSEADDAEKMELYDGSELIGSYDGKEINDKIYLETGTHYLTSLAYNANGEKTTSDTAIVYVTDGVEIEEIGETAYPGKSRSWKSGGKTYISGSGKIGKKSETIGETRDSFAFRSKEITGDFTYTVKIDEIPKYENGPLAGIMVREGKDVNSRFVMLSDTWKKYGENIIIPYRSVKGGTVTTMYMPDDNGDWISNAGSYDTEKYPMPKYMRVERNGGDLILSVSNDGVDWTNNARKTMMVDISDWSDTLYVGLAVDSAVGYTSESSAVLPWYTIAAFTEIDENKIIIEAEYDDNGKLIGSRVCDTIPEEKENTKVFIF